MIRSTLGAIIGSSMAKNTPAAGGAAGAAIAAAVPFVLSRMSIPTMIALGAGGYLAKRYYDKRKAEEGAEGAATPTLVSSRPDAPATSTIEPPVPPAMTNGSAKAGTLPTPANY